MTTAGRVGTKDAAAPPAGYRQHTTIGFKGACTKEPLLSVWMADLSVLTRQVS